MHSNVTLISHPLIQHKISILRDKSTTSKEFREIAREIAMLMAYEVTRDLELKDKTIETPLIKMTGKELAGYDIAIVPILRAGLGLVDGILEIIPNAKVGHIGLYRNEETLEPVEYYCKLPKDIENRTVIITEPMLATGGSMIGAVDLLKKYGVKKIKSMHLVCSQAGIDKLVEAHPDIEIYTPVIDKIINEDGYIVPGLGDAGDRLFGTK